MFPTRPPPVLPSAPACFRFALLLFPTLVCNSSVIRVDDDCGDDDDGAAAADEMTIVVMMGLMAMIAVM